MESGWNNRFGVGYLDRYRHIVSQVWGGRFVRNIHLWASPTVYVTALSDMRRVPFTGYYRKPREANWLIDVAMFGLVNLGLFTDTVLKWDQEGFEALGHNIELVM